MVTEQRFMDGATDVDFGTTPLREFWGKVHEVTPKSGENQQGTVVLVNFTDVEVIRLAPGATYDFPVAELPPIKYAPNKIP